MKEEAFDRSLDNPVLPADLAEALGAVRLTRLALEAAEVSEALPGEFHSQVERSGYPYPMLLTLLSYAYARGVYGSDEIEVRLRTDADFRYLCANEFPEAGTLRQFRRREWPRLSRVLTRLLELAVTGAFPGRHLDAESEASLRMERAAAADSLALDC